jgi:hypothetical protein
MTQFRYLVTCRIDSTRAYYKARIKTKHKNSTNTQKQNTKQTKQKKILYEKNNIKEVLGQNPYTLKDHS